MEGREMRRSLTLSEHMSGIDNSGHLRDLLKVRDDDGGGRHSSRRSLTLGSAMKRDAGAGASSSRTLMDIIREEQEASAGGHVPSGNSGLGVNWRAFKDRLRLRRADADSSGCPDGDDLVVSLPTSPVFGRSMSVRRTEIPLPRAVSTREGIVSEYTPAALAAAPPTEDPSASASSGQGSSSAVAAAEEQQPVRISLMALLEQTDGQGGFLTVAEEEEAEEGEERGGMFHVCCVCMVRHKGAAFIPCGHTFCRLCSRELWVSRGNCPLCNGYILEILDIF